MKKTNKNLLIINSSPRPDGISNTYSAALEWRDDLKKIYPKIKVDYIKIPFDFRGCVDCGHCIEGCRINDSFKDYINLLKKADIIMFCSPAYLNMITPQMMAFFTRLKSFARNTEENILKDKEALILITAPWLEYNYCSEIMINACKLLGFSIGEDAFRNIYIAK